MAKNFQGFLFALTLAAITATAGILWAQSSRVTALETNQAWVIETMKEIRKDIEYHHQNGGH